MWGLYGSKNGKHDRILCTLHTHEQYNITSTVVTACRLNAATSVSREPHCDGP